MKFALDSRLVRPDLAARISGAGPRLKACLQTYGEGLDQGIADYAAYLDDPYETKLASSPVQGMAPWSWREEFIMTKNKIVNGCYLWLFPQQPSANDRPGIRFYQCFPQGWSSKSLQWATLDGQYATNDILKDALTTRMTVLHARLRIIMNTKIKWGRVCPLWTTQHGHYYDTITSSWKYTSTLYPTRIMKEGDVGTQPGFPIYSGKAVDSKLTRQCITPYSVHKAIAPLDINRDRGMTWIPPLPHLLLDFSGAVVNQYQFVVEVMITGAYVPSDKNLLGKVRNDATDTEQFEFLASVHNRTCTIV